MWNATAPVRMEQDTSMHCKAIDANLIFKYVSFMDKWLVTFLISFLYPRTWDNLKQSKWSCSGLFLDFLG